MLRSTRFSTVAAMVVLHMMPLGLPAQDDATQIGDWYYQERLDPITDEDRSLVYAPPSDGGDNFMQTGLAFVCTPEGFGALVLNDSFTMANSVGVVWRVDQNEPTPEHTWRVSESRSVLVSGSTARNLADAVAAGNDRVAIRITGGINATYVFSLNGVAEALERLSCY